MRECPYYSFVERKVVRMVKGEGRYSILRSRPGIFVKCEQRCSTIYVKDGLCSVMSEMREEELGHK